MTRATPEPAWLRADWIPDLEAVDWPRLAELRETHETAIAALGSATKDADRTAALAAVCDAAETAQIELEQHFAEGEEAVRAARAEIGDIPERADERAAIKPRLEAVRRDWDKLFGLASRTKMEVLSDRGLESKVLAEVRDRRADLPAATAGPEETAEEAEPVKEGAAIA